MSKPVISVICCNYNHAQYIEQAVESICHQVFSDWEMLIVDDCSTDNSKEVIEKLVKLDDRIKTPIFLPQNKGKWFALNTAISKAEGKLITLQDSDDVSHPERLNRQHQVLSDLNSFHNLCGFQHCYTEADIYKGLQWDVKQIIGYDIINHSDVTQKVLKGFKTPGINHYYVGNDYEIHGASSLFYKQFWDFGLKFNPNSLNLMLTPGEDSDHNLRLTLLLQKTSILKDPLYLYRRNTSTNPSWKLSR